MTSSRQERHNDRHDAHQHNHRADRGFTLIELLLAMAMAAILSLTLYITLNTAIKARRTALATAQSTRAGAVAMDLICRDLESVVRPTPESTSTTGTTTAAPTGISTSGDTTGSLNGVFQGVHRGGAGSETDDLLFHTIAYEPTADPTDPLAEGTREVEFYISSDNGAPALVRRVNRNLLAPVQTNGDIEILCRNIRGFAVQYFDGQTWQTDWDSTQVGDVLPFAVRVTLTMQDPSGAVQPNGDPIVRTISRTVSIPCARVGTTTQ
jgi:prepilin-type N-terminal cleavage/methylation domain-containing protein